MLKYDQFFWGIDKSRFRSVTQWIWASTVILGLVVFGAGLLRAHRMLSCSDWPAASAVIVKSELKRGMMREGSLKHNFHVDYQYTVQRKKYHGQRISFAGSSSNHSNYRELLVAYRPGDRVEIRHHPDDHAQAVIETGVSWQGFRLAMIGGSLLIVGGLGLWWRWPLQTDYLFREHDPEKSLSLNGFLLGSLGMLACLGIFWLWWELIKMYAGR